jgi:hypothetical protein
MGLRDASGHDMCKQYNGISKVFSGHQIFLSASYHCNPRVLQLFGPPFNISFIFISFLSGVISYHYSLWPLKLYTRTWLVKVGQRFCNFNLTFGGVVAYHLLVCKHFADGC